MTLTETDKRLIRAFANQQVGAGTSKHLNSDGTRIDLRGGYRVAHWSGGLLHFDPTYGNVSQTVAKAVARAVAPMDIAAGSQWILPEATRKRIAKRKNPRGKAKRNPAYAGRLFDYKTGDDCGPATAAQVRASKAAAKRDGGAGVIVVNMRSVYAEASPKKARETYPFAKPAKRNPVPRASKAGPSGPRHGSGPERYYISDTTAAAYYRHIAPLTAENQHDAARLYLARTVLASPTFTEKVKEGNARMDRSHTYAHQDDNYDAWKANHALLNRMLAQVKRRTTPAGYAMIHGAF